MSFSFYHCCTIACVSEHSGMTLMPSLGMYCSERSWNMTFDLRRTVFSKLSRRRMCNCSFDSQNVLPRRVEVLELSTSPEAKEQIHVLFSCLLSKHWLLHLSTLPSSSKWIFLWAGLFLYRHIPWSWPKNFFLKNIIYITQVLPRKKKICSLNTCWLHAVLVMSNATVLFCEFVPHFLCRFLSITVKVVFFVMLECNIHSLSLWYVYGPAH